MARSDRNRRWCRLANGRQVELAGPGTRLLARVLDGMILAPVVVGLGVLATFVTIWTQDAAPTYSVSVVLLLASPLYEVWMIAARGATVGKFLAGAVVLRVADGELPGWSTSSRRWAVPGGISAVAIVAGILPSRAGATVGSLIQIFGGLAVILCYLSLTWDRRRQGWHDKVAGTVVVATERARRSTPLAIAGLLLALIPLVLETLLTVWIANDPDRWLSGWESLGTMLILIALTPVALGCWIGTGVLSTVALRRSRRGQVASPAIAVAGLLAAVAGVVLLVTLYWRVGT